MKHPEASVYFSIPRFTFLPPFAPAGAMGMSECSIFPQYYKKLQIQIHNFKVFAGNIKKELYYYSLKPTVGSSRMQCIYGNLPPFMYNLSCSFYLDCSLSFMSGYFVILFFKHPNKRVMMHRRSNLTGREPAELS